MASHTVSDQAFVTLATNDTYSLGALVLAHSLRQAGTSRQIAIMITAGVSEGMRHQLSTVFDVIAEVNVLDSRDTTNLALLTRPDLGVTFTKLHCWRLTQFTKCVFMDADTMALDNIDELFDREELSAAPDAGWPDCFNSGVFVFRPSLETYQSLLQFAVSHGSFDGGDQGLLNLYFSDWATKDIARHLPFIYNVVSQAFYSYLPAFRQFGKNVKVVHFIGAMKPWHHSYNTGTSQVEPSTDTLHSMDYLQKWWALFMDKVQPFLDPSANLVHIYEYHPPVVEFHPPPPPPRTLPYEEPSYQITTHYSPPDVPIYYEPFSTIDGTAAQPFENKDNRAYEHFDSFYAEPPMTHREQYPNDEHAYHAQHFTDQWEEYNKPTAEPEPQPMSEPEPQPMSEPEPRSEPEPMSQPEPAPQSNAHHEASQSESCDRDNPSHTTEDNDSVHTAGYTTHGDSEAIGGDTTTGVTDSTTVSSADSFSSKLKVDGSMSETQTEKKVHSPVSPKGHTDSEVRDRQNEDEPNNNNQTGKNRSKTEQTNMGFRVQVSAMPRPVERYIMGVVEQMGNLTITSSGGSYSQDQLEDENRRFAWDRGQIDYLGIDSFELIQAKLQSTIGKKPSPPPSEENVVPHGQPKSILKKPDKKEKEEKKPKSAIKRA